MVETLNLAFLFFSFFCSQVFKVSYISLLLCASQICVFVTLNRCMVNLSMGNSTTQSLMKITDSWKSRN